MTMMAMNKDLLSRIETFICLTLSFGILTFVVQSHLPFLALFDLEESKKELHFLFFWLEKKKIERWESANIVIREVVFILFFIFVIGKKENRKVGECKDSDKGGCLYLYIYLCDCKRRK